MFESLKKIFQSDAPKIEHPAYVLITGTMSQEKLVSVGAVAQTPEAWETIRQILGNENLGPCDQLPRDGAAVFNLERKPLTLTSVKKQGDKVSLEWERNNTAACDGECYYALVILQNVKACNVDQLFLNKPIPTPAPTPA